MFSYEIEEATAYEMISVCGLYCGVCECAKAKDDSDIMKALTDAPCPGCRNTENGCPLSEGMCDTFKCASEKNVAYCFECEAFPCDKYIPLCANDKSGHNLKLYNLCYIQNRGIKNFIQNAEEIKSKYLKSKAHKSAKQKE